ncbi:MAG TPA: GGDEF domain-containing protein, partial [Micromonosporaceae bacterium]|nr:GGDEF domain-containing protein [Micromonosporaceae bacterium]
MAVTNRRAAQIAAVLAVIFVAWIQFELGGFVIARAFSDIAIGVAAVAAGVACVYASRRHPGRSGRGWLLLGIGMLFWAVGEAIWTVYEVVFGLTVPFPSIADTQYLLMYPFALVGMIAMVDSQQRAVRTVLDALMIAGSLLFISWPLILEPIFESSDQTLLVRSFALAYPIGDIVLATMAFGLLSQSARPVRGALALAGAGLLVLAVADSFFAYLTTNSYNEISVIDGCWFVAFELIVLAALRMSQTAPSPRRHAAPLLVTLPYVPLGAAFVTSAVVQITRGTLGIFLYVTFMLLVALVLIRQVVTVRENLTLTRVLHNTVRELRQREAEMRNLAHSDPLTGLANRTLFQRRAELAIEQRAQDRLGLGILYVDLDDFKQVNDRFGHPAGDTLLLLAAERLRGCARSNDTVARIGGDEFAVLLDGLNGPRDAEAVARRVVTELALPFHLDGHTVRISASVGVALRPPGPGPILAGDLLRDADIAMYNAKFSGKNNVVWFDSMLRDRIGATGPIAQIEYQPRVNGHSVYQPLR